MNQKLDLEVYNLTESVLKTCKDIINSPNKWEGYDDWIAGHAKFKTYRVKRGTALSLRKDLTTFRGRKNYTLEEFVPLRTKANKFIEAASEYIAQVKKRSFSDQAWFVYFLFIGEHGEEPKLGRAVLKTDSYKMVELRNVPAESSFDYDGGYEIFNNRIIVFDLKSRNDGSRLHIKVAYTSPFQKVFLGAYNTFEQGHIVTGALVFYSLDENVAEKVLSPALLTLKNEFSADFEAIPEPIKLYLSKRIYNYYKVPENIPGLLQLEKFVAKYSYHKNKESRFLEIDRPTIFIAMPETSVPDHISGETNSMHKFIALLKTKTPQFKIEYASTRSLKDQKDILPQNTLEKLRTTSIFVLIISESTAKSSFSLVQLGWALAHCKKIIVIYREGTISKRMSHLEEVDGVSLWAFKDLEEELSEIVEKIKKHINQDAYDF